MKTARALLRRLRQAWCRHLVVVSYAVSWERSHFASWSETQAIRCRCESCGATVIYRAKVRYHDLILLGLDREVTKGA